MAQTVTTISSPELSAAVSSEGAQLMSLVHDGVEYLWQGDERWWPRRAPVLFPIVGALRNDRCTTAHGEAAMPQHGVARRFTHQIKAVTDKSVTFRLESSEETKELFPYDFVLEMTYEITDEGALLQTFKVINTDSLPLPFQLGGHPAFNVPLDPENGERFEDYQLVFSRPWTYASPQLNDDHLLDWEAEVPVVEGSDTLPLRHDLFAHDALVLTDVPDSCVTLRSAQGDRGITVDFPGFDYCGIWSCGDAPFCAIEPWTGTATGTAEDDELAHKRGVVMLEPGETFERTFTMRPF